MFGTRRPNRVVDVVLSLLRMQAPSASRSDSPGLCVASTLTADGRVGLEVGLQLGVGLVMVVLVAVSQWVRSTGSRCSFRSSRRTISGAGTLHVGLLDSAYGDSIEGPSRMHSLNVLSSGTSSSWAPAPMGGSSPASVGTLLPPRARCITAAVNFGVTAYSTVTVATINMLHCVWVPGTPPHHWQRRLFIRGSVVCDYSGWQAPHVVVLAVLVAVPFLLPLAASWSRRDSQHGKLQCVISTRVIHVAYL